MKINLTMNLDTESSFKSKTISDLDHILQDFFKEKKYSDDLDQILVGIIAIRELPGYEKWFKPRPPKYIFHKTVKDPILKNKTYEINKTYECEFRFSNEDYEIFISEGDNISKILLGKYLLNLLSDWNYLKKKINRFDETNFIKDLNLCLKQNYYLE